tara:strand:- start:134 stop:982 length:849 start_codon:yes stop_codon:yes gene_type:complete
MASNMIIGILNYVDSPGTISADTAVGTLPVSNLQDRQLVKVFRNTATSSVITVDFGSIKTIDHVALVDHNITQAGTINIDLSTVSDFSVLAYDGAAEIAWPTAEEFGTLPWGVFVWGGILGSTVGYKISSYAIMPTTIAARYLRITISDSTNTDGYIQAGRLVAGPSYVPSVNAAFGMEFEFVDNSRVSKSRGGQTFIDEVDRYRVCRFELRNIPQDEMMANVFNNLDRLRGVAKDVLIIPQPDDSDTWITQNVYGRVISSSPVYNTGMSLYGRQFEIEELI